MSRAVVLVACVLLLGAVEWEHMQRQGWRHDEAWTLEPAVGPLELGAWPEAPVSVGELADRLARPEDHGPAQVVEVLSGRSFMHPPAYYLLLNAWFGVAGTQRWAVRLPGLVLGIVALLGLARLAKHVVPAAGAGSWAVALATVASWFGVAAHIARPYVMALALALWSTVALLDMCRDERGRRAALVFLATSVLGLYTLYHYAFVLGWQAVLLVSLSWGRGRSERGRAMARAGVLLGIVAIAFVPWLPVLKGHLADTGEGSLYFSGAVAWSEVFGRSLSLVRHFLVSALPVWAGRLALRDVLHALLAATVVVAAWRVVRRRRQRSADAGDGHGVEPPDVRIFWWTVPVLPALVVVADLWHGTHTVFIAKIVFGFFPLIILVIVRAWLGRRPSWLSHAGLGVWWALMAVTLGLSVVQGRLWFSDKELLARDMAAYDDPAHLIVVNSSHRGDLMPLVLTLRDTGLAELRLTYAPPDRLGEIVDELLAREDVERLSLVNMPRRCQCFEPTEPWSREQLEGARRRAVTRGWSCDWRPPGRRPEPVSVARRMEIISPMRGYRRDKVTP